MRLKPYSGAICVQVFGMAPSALPHDGQGLAVEPEKPGSDVSKRINAVIGCVRSGFRSLIPGFAGVPRSLPSSVEAHRSQGIVGR